MTEPTASWTATRRPGVLRRGVRRRRDRRRTVSAWAAATPRRWPRRGCYGDAPGLVLRCAGCDAVLLRLVSGGGRHWLDVRGLTYLEFTDESAP